MVSQKLRKDLLYMFWTTLDHFLFTKYFLSFYLSSSSGPPLKHMFNGLT